jgi:hypothetical protein
VKNVYPKNPEIPYRFNEAYLPKLRRYADRFQRDLKIAIYWPQWKNMWTIVSVDKIRLQGPHRCISFPEAMVVNEMRLLGDWIIATTPPLGLRFYTDSDYPHTIEADGSVGDSYSTRLQREGTAAVEIPVLISLRNRGLSQATAQRWRTG